MEHQSKSLNLPEVTRISVVTGLGRHGYVLACSIKAEDETMEKLLHVCVAVLGFDLTSIANVSCYKTSYRVESFHVGRPLLQRRNHNCLNCNRCEDVRGQYRIYSLEYPAMAGSQK